VGHERSTLLRGVPVDSSDMLSELRVKT